MNLEGKTLDKLTSLSNRIKSIFERENIRGVDVTEANYLIAQYKALSGWRERTEPVLI
jgi:hypothetical protein